MLGRFVLLSQFLEVKRECGERTVRMSWPNGEVQQVRRWCAECEIRWVIVQNMACETAVSGLAMTVIGEVGNVLQAVEVWNVRDEHYDQ